MWDRLRCAYSIYIDFIWHFLSLQNAIRLKDKKKPQSLSVFNDLRAFWILPNERKLNVYCLWQHNLILVGGVSISFFSLNPVCSCNCYRFTAVYQMGTELFCLPNSIWNILLFLHREQYIFANAMPCFSICIHFKIFMSRLFLYIR